MSIKAICKYCQSPVTIKNTSFCSDNCRVKYDEAKAENLQKINFTEISKKKIMNNNTEILNGGDFIYKSLYNELKKQYEDMRLIYSDIKSERDNLKVQIDTIERKNEIEKQKYEDDFKLKIREKELELKENSNTGLNGFAEGAKDLLGKIMPGGIKDLLEGLAVLKGQQPFSNQQNNADSALAGLNIENQLELQNILNVLGEVKDPERVLTIYKKIIMVYSQSPEQFAKIQTQIERIFEQVKSSLIN